MSRFAKYAWFVTGYTILVILWGAVVRITGSGAGCGNHWPACNGEILYRPEYIETMIELSHRLTSALAGFFVLILLIWAFRKTFEHNQRLIRRMTVMTFIFILIEGALGAALVRLELVGDNASVARAVMIALHLVNTLILLGFSTGAAWAASQPRQVRYKGFNADASAILTGMLGILLVSAIGAITALGNTLFPSESLVEGIRADFDPTSHFLIQLRIWHPAIALATSGFLFWYGYRVLNRDDVTPQQTQLVNWLFGTVTLQIIVGFMAIALLAPIWVQLSHLLLADVLWMVLVVMAGNALTEPVTKEKRTETAPSDIRLDEATSALA